MDSPRVTHHRFFYGWVVVAVATLALVVSNGLSIGGIPVFYKSIREDFVASGAVAVDQAESFIAFGFSLTFLFSGLISPLAGWLIHRFRVKPLMLVGCALLGGGLVLHATANSAAVVYAARILMGVSLGFVGVLPSVVLVSDWFVRRRGTALGILLTGTSLGGVLVGPVATRLIELFGWRTAMIMVSLIIWILLAPAIVLLIRSSPNELGLLPDGDEELPKDTGPSAVTGTTFSEALRMPRFWIFALGSALIFYPILVTSQQLILQTARIGFTPRQGSVVLSGLFAISLAGKFLFGYLSDRFAPIRVVVVCVATMFAATFFLIDLNAMTALLFLVPFGLGYGGAFVLIQRLVADLFGERDYPKILGAITICETLGAVFGGIVTGWLADRYGGDYAVGFYGVIVATGIALVLVIVLNLRKLAPVPQP
jgi:MFS family permease